MIIIIIYKKTDVYLTSTCSCISAERMNVTMPAWNMMLKAGIDMHGKKPDVHPSDVILQRGSDQKRWRIPTLKRFASFTLM